MSDKPFAKLDRSDAALRRATHAGMTDGIHQFILRESGFELFNSRPYHNYETWSDGYCVVGRRDRVPMSRAEVAAIITAGGSVAMPNRDDYIEVNAEDLDDACRKFQELIAAAERAPTS